MAVPRQESAPTLRRKAIPFTIKALSDEGSFDLYAAVFGNIDRQGEIIAPGAFTNLGGFAKDGCGLANHQTHSLPVALIDSAVADNIGLRITGRFHSTPEAQACRTVVKERLAAGKSVSCSIGYRTLDSASEVRDGKTIWILKSIELYEFSFVNFPANPLATVATVKSWTRGVERAFRELKEGRVLSAANRRRLESLHGQMSQASEDLRALLEGATPDADAGTDSGPPPIPPPLKPAGQGLVAELLANEASYPDYMLGAR
ncbi:MAG: HK97 family phage prohead protease [Alphaproteobacteria bacterium]